MRATELIEEPFRDAEESRARRAARKVGLVARKSRWRLHTGDNRGGFQIIDPNRNWILAGEKFDKSPDHVVRFCQGREPV